MKKRNIFAILAALAVMLVVFAACGDKEPEQPENPTVVGADGQVYEEVTEIATEIVTEIVSEVVTDKQGEAVTDKEGKTEVVTEVKTEVLTTVVTVTVPYEPSTAETTTDKKQETTTASEPSSEGSSVESTTTYEDVTFPEGTLIEVEMGSDGRPKEPLMEKVMNASANSKQFYLNATIVTGEMLGFETGMPVKMYIDDNDMAFEFAMAAMKLRMVYAGNKMHMIFPTAKAYYSIDAGESGSGLSDSEFNLWGTIGSDTMDYVSTSRVTLKGVTYTCEEYTDSSNTNKYYFNGKNQLKRIEIITQDGQVTILKIAECSAKVDKSIFNVPKGYTKLTEDSMEKLFGGMI